MKDINGVDVVSDRNESLDIFRLTGTCRLSKFGAAVGIYCDEF